MKRLKLALIVAALAWAQPIPAFSADFNYREEGYSQATCLELARREAQTNLEVIYLYPGRRAGEIDAKVQAKELKQERKALQREQHRLNCI